MKANELRIGNWVYIPQTKTNEQIGVIEENGRFLTKGYKTSYSSIECSRPIQLTEEWLKRLGFKRCGYDLLYWEHETLLKGFQLTGINWADADEPDYQFLNYSIGDNIFSIHYVHQLQNLYFALTGEELVVNEQ
jgi:hypothetical protein